MLKLLECAQEIGSLRGEIMELKAGINRLEYLKEIKEAELNIKMQEFNKLVFERGK